MHQRLRPIGPYLWRQPIWAWVAVLLFGFGLAEVNAHYAYRPTVSDVLGFPLPDSTLKAPHAVAELRVVRIPGTELTVASVGGVPVSSSGLTFSELARLEDGSVAM